MIHQQTGIIPASAFATKNDIIGQGFSAWVSQYHRCYPASIDAVKDVRQRFQLVLAVAAPMPAFEKAAAGDYMTVKHSSLA